MLNTWTADNWHSAGWISPDDSTPIKKGGKRKRTNFGRHDEDTIIAVLHAFMRMQQHDR